MSELIDFNTQKNWDFMKFDGSLVSGVLSSEGQARLKNRCQRVLESAQKTAESVCVLGYELRALRESGEWKFVVNPEDGMRFLYSSFEKFSEYAFGFGRTYTSNLTLLAEFCEKDESGRVQIKERYRGFKQSGLVELAPLSEFERKQFTSDMTIKDIRLCKKYMQTSNYLYQRARDGFNLLESAKAWQDFEKIGSITPPSSVQIPTSGFSEPENIQSEPFEHEFSDDVAEMDAEFHRTFAEEETRETFGQADDVDEYEPETFWQGGGLDNVDEPAPAEVYAHEPPSVSDSCLMPNSKSYELTARDKVRKFLKDYKNWTKIDKENLAPGVVNEYEYIFESEKVSLIAREVRWFKDMESKVEKVVVRFYWDTLYGDGYIEASKAKLEKFIPAHLDELKWGAEK
jgi:hypothetical protein